MKRCRYVLTLQRLSFSILCRSPWVHSMLLVVAGAIVYANTLSNSFHLDDFHTIVNNPAIRTVHPVWRHFVEPDTMSILDSNVSYRPLLPLSLSITYYFWGLDVTSYHLFNTSTHLLAAVMLYLVVGYMLRLTSHTGWRSLFIATGAALLFVVHPYSGAVVNYLCSRDNIMMQFFLLLALYSYLRARRERAGVWWGIVLLSYSLALCSKPVAVIFPLLIVAVELSIFHARTTVYTAVARGMMIAVPAVLYAGIVKILTQASEHVLAMTGGRVSSTIAYQAQQGWIQLSFYLRQAVWPFSIRGLAGFPDNLSGYDPRSVIGIVCVIGTIALAWYIRKRLPLVACCIWAYWIMFAPTSLLPLYEKGAVRWMYYSLPYLCILGAWLVSRIPRRVLSVGCLAFLVFWFGSTSFLMNRHWRTEKTFYEQCVRYGADATGYMNLGLAVKADDPTRARDLFEESLTLAPEYYLAHINLGLLELEQGNTNRALELARAGLAFTPAGCEVIARPGAFSIISAAGMHDEALALVRSVKSSNSLINNLYFAAYQCVMDKEYDAGLRYLDELHDRTERYELSRFLSGWCRHQTGDLPGALADYHQSITYEPDYMQAYLNAGYAARDLRDHKRAAYFFNGYLQRNPDDETIQALYRDCLQHTPNPEESIGTD